MANEITKEFWKNSHFENRRAGFLLRCQNLLQWNTPEKMHFQEWHFFYFHQYCPSNRYCSHQKESVLYLDDILIIFGDPNTSKRQLLFPWINISMTNQAFFSPKWVLPPQKKNTSHIFKIDIFSKFFGDVMSHIIRWNAGKKINTVSELLFKNKKINSNLFCF